VLVSRNERQVEHLGSSGEELVLWISVREANRWDSKRDIDCEGRFYKL